MRASWPEELVWRRSLVLSVGLHLTALILLSGVLKFGSQPKEVIYSVTIEGGTTLGGKGQAPDENAKKTPLAPPKAVSEERPKEIVEKQEDAEVSTKTEPVKKVEKPLKKEVVKPPEKKEPPKPPEKKEVKKPVPQDIDQDYKKAMQKYLGESANAGGKGFGAAKLGGKGMGGGTVISPEAYRYIKLLESLIHQEWRWFDRADITAEVSFSVSRDGKIGQLEIARSSGVREFDNSVLRALNKIDRAPPPPDSVFPILNPIILTMDPRDG